MSAFKIVDGVLKEYYGNDLEVFVPEGVTEIDSSTFAEYRNTVFHKRVIHLPDSVKKIGNGAFSGCVNLESINIPDGVTEIGERAFYECKSLSHVDLPDGVTHIAEALFWGCSSLASIKISHAVTCIGTYAFAGTKLERFDFPHGLERIDDGAFANCWDLPRIYIPRTIREISDSAFIGMRGAISVEDGHPVYSSEEGALLRDNGKTLMCVPHQESYEYTIPQQVENITSYALGQVLHKITLHSAIKSIGDEAIKAYSIHAPLDARPEHIGKNVFRFPSGSDPLTYPELPVTYVPEEAYRRRLALGYCQNHDRYAADYAADYEAYIRSHLEDMKRLANKQQLMAVQEFLAAMEADMPLTIPEDCSKLKPLEKVELLERMVLRGDAQQVEKVMKSCKKLEFSARALGIACRYRSLDVVKALVENGATFEYEWKASFKTRYAAAIKTRYSQIEHWASYELMLVYTGMNPVIPTINASAYDVHFGGLPLIDRVENTAEERAAIVEYLLQKEEINPSYILIYALMWGCRPVAECLLKKGESIDTSLAYVRSMLDGSGTSDLRSEMLATLPLLSEEDCAFALEKYGEAAEKAGIKIALPKKLFDEEDTVFLKGQVLAQVMRFADTKKLSKASMLNQATLRDDAEALSVLAQAGWIGKKAQMDQLIQFATSNGCTAAAAWLMSYMNQTIDIARETEKEEKKAMRELTANPNSITALKKLWGFKKLENGMLEIISYKGEAVEAEVPAMIGKEAVCAIGEYAFSACSKSAKNKESRKQIERIVIPEGITEIGDYAFAGCEMLRDIQLPNTLESIGAGTFLNCSSLAQIRLPDNLKELRGGRGSTGTFEGCNTLESISIPKTVKDVSVELFKGCDKLMASKGLLIIDGRLLSYTGSEDTVVVPEGVFEICDIAFSSKYANRKPTAFVRKVVLPNSLGRIGRNAFRGQKCLAEIELPAGLKEIGAGAFESCALTSVRIPNGVTELSEDTFAYCSKLCKVELPAGLTEISGFNGCTSLKEITIPDNVCKIGRSAFANMSSLKKITIPRHVTEISDSAFIGTGLETLYVPDTVQKVGNGAFAGMLSLKDLWLPDSIEKLDSWFLGKINTDEVRIHLMPNSRLAKNIYYKNLVYDYPEGKM